MSSDVRLMSYLPLLDRFRLQGVEQKEIRSNLFFVLESADLTRCPKVTDLIARHKKVAGIYFWTALVNGEEYKVYAGQTNSLSYRITNYTAPFQPHSPNDFKLLIFSAFMKEIAPESTLRLYSREVAAMDLKVEEKAFIAKHQPLLNVSRKPTAEARNKLRDAFSQFYRASFEGVLRNDV
nr:putative integron gene cassette protein [uncultured bacterium]